MKKKNYEATYKEVQEGLIFFDVLAKRKALIHFQSGGLRFLYVFLFIFRHHEILMETDLSRRKFLVSLRKPLQLNENVRKLCKLSECDFLFLKTVKKVFYIKFNFCMLILPFFYLNVMTRDFRNHFINTGSSITNMYYANKETYRNINLVIKY